MHGAGTLPYLCVALQPAAVPQSKKATMSAATWPAAQSCFPHPNAAAAAAEAGATAAAAEVLQLLQPVSGASGHPPAC